MSDHGGFSCPQHYRGRHVDFGGLGVGRIPTPPAAPTAPDARSLPMPHFDSNATSTTGAFLPSHNDSEGKCDKPSCAQTHRKLSDAMQANRAWERRFNELRSDSLRYTQDLEKDLQRLRDENEDRFYPQKPGNGRGRERELERQIEEQEVKLSTMQERLQFLDTELRSSREEVLRVREAADNIQVLREQLQCYREDFNTERADRERLQSEKEELRERLVVAQQQASTHQANFVAARREKDELLLRLRTLAQPLGEADRPFYGYHSQPAGCEINGYGYDEAG